MPDRIKQAANSRRAMPGKGGMDDTLDAASGFRTISESPREAFGRAVVDQTRAPDL